MEKQKLQARLKNVPKDAPQVLCSTSMALNKEETLSVPSIVPTCNNPEVDLLQHTEVLKANVYVLSIEGKPLMPCSPAKARKLLKSGRAKVVKLYPFTIQLNFKCENQVQDVTLGIDSGYENIGFSAKSSKKELASSTLKLDGRTSERLTERKMYRKGRKARHHWYREPKFSNRTKPEGWLPPSIQRRYDTHLSLIKKYQAILPITEITIETANFDIAKIENPEISNEQYQQGDLYGYQNERSYLMAREHGLCQLCHKPFGKGDSAHIHHCKQRSESGSNSVKNKAPLHEKCHKKLHKQGLKLPAPKSYKPNIFMSIIHNKFRQDIPDVKITFGYITFIKRNEIGLPKTHYNDAFVIAGGTDQERCKPIEITQKHRNNRAIQLNRNGFKPAIRKQRYSIQPKDLIWIGGKRLIVGGIQNKGSQVKIANSKKVLPTKNIEKIYNFGSFAYN
jgi:hypothetical protein